MYMKLVLVVSSLVATGQAECPDIAVKQDFLLPYYYAGTWYQQAQFNKPANHAFNKCVKSTYTYNEANDNYDVLIEQALVIFNNKLAMTGTLQATEKSKNEGKLTLTLDLPFVGKNAGPEYVLGTDYENWSVVYSCREAFGKSTMGAWILTRKQNLSEYSSEELANINKQVDDILTAAGLKRKDFITTDQKSC